MLFFYLVLRIIEYLGICFDQQNKIQYGFDLSVEKSYGMRCIDVVNQD